MHSLAAGVGGQALTLSELVTGVLCGFLSFCSAIVDTSSLDSASLS
jgi:hypothetical protein